MIRRCVSIVVFALALSARSAFPCACDEHAQQVAAPLLTVDFPMGLVVVAEVQSYWGQHPTEPGMPDAMVVRVTEVLHGALASKTLRVRVNGGLCPPYVAAFPIGTSWVLHLYSDRERAGSYSVSSCGEHWLPLVNGRVRGYIVQGPRDAPEITMLLPELRWRFQELAAGRKMMEDMWKAKPPK